MEALRFVAPDESMEQEAQAFVEAFSESGENVINGSGGLDFFPDYATWLREIRAVESGVKEGLVPSAKVRFARLANSGKIVGVVDYRPGLPENKRYYGHVGYSVMPQERGKGYAVEMVRWACKHLQKAGAGPIQASVYEDNAPSRRVLEKNGFSQSGAMEEADSGRTILVYTKD